MLPRLQTNHYENGTFIVHEVSVNATKTYNTTSTESNKVTNFSVKKFRRLLKKGFPYCEMLRLASKTEFSGIRRQKKREK